MCPNICTGDKGGASGDNTIDVVVGVDVVVGAYLAKREAPGDSYDDGGLQGSAHRDSSGRDGVVVVGSVVVVVVVVEVTGDTYEEEDTEQVRSRGHRASNTLSECDCVRRSDRDAKERAGRQGCTRSGG